MMPGEQKLKVFISGTSHDLQSYRKAAAEWARARDHLPVEEKGFELQPDHRTIVQMLREKLAPCDAVIHLAGLWYGGEPTNCPDDELRRSYSQLEYELGRELRRQTFRFVAREDYRTDRPLDGQDAERAKLQIRHRQRLTLGSEPWSPDSRTTGNELYYEFSTPEELVSQLGNLQIRPTTVKPNNLPYESLGSLFKGRDEFLVQLRAVLVNKPTHIAAVTRRHAIHGLGGVGKTRAAIEYAWQHEYDAILFVKAESPEDLERNLAGLCGPLVLDLPQRDSQELEVQLAAAVRWLRDHAGWLLILDNVDTEEAQAAVEQQLAAISTGHVIITSRLTHWEGGVESLALDVLPLDAAVRFLLERTDGERQMKPSDPDDAQALAADLDSLALTLEQAGAYIVRHGIRLASYRERWANQDHRVLTWFNENQMKYPRSVATTWETSLAELNEDARTLLDILSWLAPDPIPRFLLEQLEEIEDAPVLDLDAAPGDLTSYSLASWQDERTGIDIHRLVQEITRWRFTAKVDREASFISALRMVKAAFPRDPNDICTWPDCSVIQPHAAQVTSFAEPFGNPVPTAKLLHRLGLYLNGRAEHHAAKPLFRRALKIDEASYGPNHPEVAIFLNNLADLLQATNRVSEADPLFRRALEICTSSRIMMARWSW